ncbi:hypothetical protein BDR06DRAFT_57308 [Suillus hirtellus]|nr:hypothetical protein BDR06DRAFT_57308 [Suillus hirtellus]
MPRHSLSAIFAAQAFKATITSYHCNPLPSDQLPSSTRYTMNGIRGFRVPEPQAQSHPPLQASHSHIAHHWVVKSQIAPGTITYTTITDADGQATNYPFRAIPVRQVVYKSMLTGSA